MAPTRKYNDAAAKGYFPLTLRVADIDPDGSGRHRQRHRDRRHRRDRPQPHDVRPGPSPTGWQLSQAVGSVAALAVWLNRLLRRTS